MKHFSLQEFLEKQLGRSWKGFIYKGSVNLERKTLFIQTSKRLVEELLSSYQCCT
ncbi:hypothetical protein KFK09_003140 [Dendrobium nobile]|uniref:Uncharacterized protein n=1 Tax=Dendrobium nobile TaxID=94219 RepID=A0A8T3C9A5_DENNO|nr:hypothetical protein KFK09_003140 [Dendrobium nobile]